MLKSVRTKLCRVLLFMIILLMLKEDLSSYEALQDNHLFPILRPEFSSQTPLERSQQQQPPPLQEFHDFSHDSIPITTAWSGGDDIVQSWVWDDLFQIS